MISEPLHRVSGFNNRISLKKDPLPRISERPLWMAPCSQLVFTILLKALVNVAFSRKISFPEFLQYYEQKLLYTIISETLRIL